MDRRDFLKWQAAGLACLGAGGGLLGLTGRALGAEQPTPDLAVARGLPAAATRAAVNLLGGMSRFVKAGQKVVVKPNMSFATGPEQAANTHPEVVREVLIMCREAGAGSVRVLDHPLQNPEQALESSGILAACESVQRGICHQLMSEQFYAAASIPRAVEMRDNLFMKDVLEADVLIAVPVAKSHGGAGVSLSLKGQMGLILDRGVMHSRYDLATAIVDLNTLVRPHLAVIDASRVLSTGGPGGPGKVLTPGEVIASADPVAADALAVASYEWYDRKFEPRQVSYLRLAHERGLGRMDIENLNIQRTTV